MFGSTMEFSGTADLMVQLSVSKKSKMAAGAYLGYTKKSIIFSARQHAERAICYRPSVCPSVRPSVCHTGGSVKNG